MGLIGFGDKVFCAPRSGEDPSRLDDGGKAVTRRHVTHVPDSSTLETLRYWVAAIGHRTYVPMLLALVALQRVPSDSVLRVIATG